MEAGNRWVSGPEEGTGYVYCDGTKGVPSISFDNGIQGEGHRKVIMSYPIFETDSGLTVDFKNGIWETGSYIEQPLRFINFAALNHHSTYCGATSAVLASMDPVALDYHAAKYVLYPNSKIALYNPDDQMSPLHQYLAKCAEKGGTTFGDEGVEIKSNDILT